MEQTPQQTAWEFVEKYYPNYHSSQEISDNDLLQRIFDSEFDPNNPDDAAAILYREIGQEVMPTDFLIKKQAAERLQQSNALIYERAILEFMNAQKAAEKTYYLFGDGIILTYLNEGIDAAVNEAKNNQAGYGIFCATEGVTTISDFIESHDGWSACEEISEEEYAQLYKLQ